MINALLFKLQRPEKGWDPVSAAHARAYSDHESGLPSIESTMQDVVGFAGDLRGKQVLDLGAGPGHFTAAFAERGAVVTWQDISRNYLDIFRARYRNLRVDARLGYLEEAAGEFDLVFNSLCWYYSLNDKRFARHVVGLLKPGGCAYLVIPNEGHYARQSQAGFKGLLRRVQFVLNDRLGFKVGHPFVSSRTIKHIFADIPLDFISFTERGDRTVVKLKKAEVEIGS
jgi:SAM-dependent methyltransferase